MNTFSKTFPIFLDLTRAVPGSPATFRWLAGVTPDVGPFGSFGTSNSMVILIFALDPKPGQAQVRNFKFRNSNFAFINMSVYQDSKKYIHFGI